ncbi:MAG TPA: SdpI family protein [Candidatus Alectryocaccomicrobium excrementavium]|uniref:SdpI family protein n=1 Tax=Candidatus Alectryocaccomicrobium excrementavium TaxID=2840668 RepID=A0A9D1G0P2_9FIRM|nr:SdpI family protein [Candidatus Alectryocaccomicrobium excrementavium]
MDFWWFMAMVNALLPAILIGFGKYFMRHAPRDINPFFGYRTARSMQNMDTWNFAHQYCGKVWFSGGLTALPLSLLIMLCVRGQSEDAIAAVGLCVTAAQIIFLFVSVALTEAALKKAFDAQGRRRA